MNEFLIGLGNVLLAAACFAILLIFGILYIIGKLISDNYEQQERRYRGFNIANIDYMDGIEFEHYLNKLLIFKGYKSRVTEATGDLGVDLVASKDGEIFAIQAKRYNTKVSRRAVSDAVAGIDYYDCDRAMVITNNYFTPGAVALAQANGCILIDRDTLLAWVNEYQESISVINNHKIIDNKKNSTTTQPNKVTSPPKTQDNGNPKRMFYGMKGLTTLIYLILIMSGCCSIIGIFNYLWTNY